MQAVVCDELTLASDESLEVAIAAHARHRRWLVKGPGDIRVRSLPPNTSPRGIEGASETAWAYRVTPRKPRGETVPPSLKHRIAPKGRGKHGEEAVISKEALRGLNEA